MQDNYESFKLKLSQMEKSNKYYLLKRYYLFVNAIYALIGAILVLAMIFLYIAIKRNEQVRENNTY